MGRYSGPNFRVFEHQENVGLNLPNTIIKNVKNRRFFLLGGGRGFLFGMLGPSEVEIFFFFKYLHEQLGNEKDVGRRGEMKEKETSPCGRIGGGDTQTSGFSNLGGNIM